MKKQKVCIITSVHPPLDQRIFYKQAISLKKAGYDVTLVGPYEEGIKIEEIKYIPLKKQRNRVLRILKTTRDAARKSLKINPDIIHLHDPELLLAVPYIRKIKGDKLKIIFDIHENVPAQIKGKEWIPAVLRNSISRIYKVIEGHYIKMIDQLIIAEESYFELYKNQNNVTLIRNSPLLINKQKETMEKINDLVYIGSISEQRGIFEMIKAVKYLKDSDYHVRLDVVGRVTVGAKNIEKAINTSGVSGNINMLGYVPILEAYKILWKSKVGLSLVHHQENHLKSNLVKLFDYMNAGIPIVASNLPATKELVEGNKCGIVVDPFNTNQVAESIKFLLNNPKKAKELGDNGREAVRKYFNWPLEEKKLLDLYKKIIQY